MQESDIPTISYVIPCWAGSSSDDLRKSLSCINHRYVSEVILVLDGSVNDSLLSCASYYNDLLTVVSLPKNQGPGLARNYGVSQSTGSIIFFMDIGDYYEPDRAPKMLEEVRKNGYAYSRAQIDGGPRKSRIYPISLNFLNSISSLWLIPVAGASLAVNRSLFDRVGGYPSLRFGEDWVLLNRLYRATGTLSIVPSVLLKYDTTVSNRILSLQQIIDLIYACYFVATTRLAFPFWVFSFLVAFLYQIIARFVLTLLYAAFLRLNLKRAC